MARDIPRKPHVMRDQDRVRLGGEIADHAHFLLKLRVGAEAGRQTAAPSAHCQRTGNGGALAASSCAG